MKRSLLVLFCVCLYTIACYSQPNMVPNGDFEDYYMCPTSTSQVVRCVGWNAWSKGSSDYFNTCASIDSFVSVPANTFGYQYAHSGNGYMGGFSSLLVTANSKEYITREITPLEPKAFYVVSISVSCADKSKYGTNDVGVYFYKDGPTYYPNQSYKVNVTPQIEWPETIVTDTQNWTRLEKLFFSDSAYTNIAIGGFGDITSHQSSPQDLTGLMYYYYDSIVVKLYDTIYLDAPRQTLCAGDTISVQYYSFMKKNAGNIFTIQLSDPTGSFTTPVNIGSANSDTSGFILITIPANTIQGNGYKMRLISSDYKDTSLVSATFDIAETVQNFSANNNGPICKGETLLLNVLSTTTGVTYKWNGPGGFYSENNPIVVNNAQIINSGDYTVTASKGRCSVSKQMNVTVKPFAEEFSTSANTPLCAGSAIRLEATSATADVTYSWAGPNGYTSSTATPVIGNATISMSGLYEVTANRDGCELTDTVSVLVKPLPDSISASSNSPVWEGEDIELNASNTTVGAIYKWQGPVAYSSYGQNQIIGRANKTAAGWYIVNAELDGCSIYDSTLVQINEIPGGDGLVLYPNPNYGSFIISGNINTNDYLLLTITNVLEQELYREGLQPTNAHINHRVNMHEIAAGVYLLNIMTAKKIIRMKFVVL